MDLFYEVFSKKKTKNLYPVKSKGKLEVQIPEVTRRSEWLGYVTGRSLTEADLTKNYFEKVHQKTCCSINAFKIRQSNLQHDSLRDFSHSNVMELAKVFFQVGHDSWSITKSIPKCCFIVLYGPYNMTHMIWRLCLGNGWTWPLTLKVLLEY